MKAPSSLAWTLLRHRDYSEPMTCPLLGQHIQIHKKLTSTDRSLQTVRIIRVILPVYDPQSRSYMLKI